MPGMTEHSSEAPPTWFRLSEASWAEIGEAYRNGATAKELSALWKVSPGSIYRHAQVEGWTKKRHADDVARAHVAARRAEADEGRQAAGASPARARRADGVAASGPPPSSDPAEMKAAALTRLASAIHDGRDHEALRLSALIQRLDRLIVTAADRPDTPGAADPAARSVPQGLGEPGNRPWPKPPPEGYPDDGGHFIDWRPTREAVERETASMFRMIAFTALAMLHKPAAVHPVFMRMVYRFRRDVLGETNEDNIRQSAEYITEQTLLKLEEFAFERVDVVNPDTGMRQRLRTWPPADPPFPQPGWKRKRLQTRVPTLARSAARPPLAPEAKSRHDCG
ncbi:hypothetical protein DBR21_15040 [Caulobacter sp. HMWF009]|nr:hypothetical protein DBR21_15040 [Caulobacter sp. HMWF009]